MSGPGGANLSQSVSTRAQLSGNSLTYTQTLTQKSTDRYQVYGEDNQVDYGALQRAVDAHESGAANAQRLGKELIRRSSFSQTLEPGASYAIDASGEIDKNGSWVPFGDVDPGERTDDGTTRLQFFVSNADGEVIDRINFRPGLTINPDDAGYPEGSQLHAVFQDSGAWNNSGSFNVEVERTEKKIVQEAVVPEVSDISELEDLRPNLAVCDAPAEASVPSPAIHRSGIPADRALAVDRESGTVATHGGYEIQTFDDPNTIRVVTPDGQASTFDFADGVWRESDSTVGLIDQVVKDGNFVLGDGTTLAWKQNDDGEVRGLTIASDNARVEIDGVGGYGRPRIGRLNDDGLQWRLQRFEETGRTNFYQTGFGEEAYGSEVHDKQVGWYATQGGTNLGWVEAQSDGWRVRNQADDWVPPQIDEALRPPLGSQSYERALNNIMYQELGETSGRIQDRAYYEGYDIDPSLAREAALDYMQPRVQQLAEANQLNQLAAQYPGLLTDRMYGQTPNYYDSMQQSYLALAQLQAVLQMQAMLAAQALPPQMIYR